MSFQSIASGWPVVRGIQTLKEIAYLNMRTAAAAAGLSKLWSDTFLTQDGIDSGLSSVFSYRGTPNFDVIRVSGYGSNVLTGGTPSDDDTHGTLTPNLACDGNTGTRWSTGGARPVPHYWQYDFGAGVKRTISKWRCFPFYEADVVNFYISASNDGTNWTTLYTKDDGIPLAAGWNDFTFTNTTAYRYYRFNITLSDGDNYVSVYEFEAYELLAILSTPTMTSNSAPSGVAAASRESGGAAYKAFDRVVSGSDYGWGDSSHGGFPQWLSYAFPAGTSKIVTRYGLIAANTVANRAPRDFKLQGSNNNTDWTDLDTQSGVTFSANQQKIFEFANSTAYRYYRLYVSAVSSGDEVVLQELELYVEQTTTAEIVSVLALNLATNISQVMLFCDVTLNTGTAAYYISTDNGSTWTAVTPETLAAVPAGKQVRIKVSLTGDAELESWGVAA